MEKHYLLLDVLFDIEHLESNSAQNVIRSYVM